MWQGDEKYTFQIGDVLHLGIKRYIGANEYIVQKDFEVQEESDIVEIILLESETNNIPYCSAIMEIALKYNNSSDYRTVYQEEIELKGVVIEKAQENNN